MTSRSDDTSRPRALRALGGIRLGHLVLAGTLLITLLAAGGIYIVVHRSHRSAASGVAGPKAPPDQPSETLPAPQLSETATGNIFTPGHIPSFLVDAAEAKTVSFQVYDYYDNLVKSGVVDVAGGRATLTVAGLTYGYYLISVRDNVHGETSSPGQDAFAVLPPATALDEHFGLNTHLSQGEPSSLLTLLTDIGIRKVRDGPKYVSEFHSAGVSLQTTQVISPKPTGETPDATNHKGRFPTTPAAVTNDIQATIAYLESNPLAANDNLAVPSGCALTLDLAGYDLSITDVGSGEAGIAVPTGASLVIEDTSAAGTLTATGNNGGGNTGFGGGAGIGGNDNGGGSGAVTILSGTVTATGAGGSYTGSGGGAGIGGGGGWSAAFTAISNGGNGGGFGCGDDLVGSSGIGGGAGGSDYSTDGADGASGAVINAGVLQLGSPLVVTASGSLSNTGTISSIPPGGNSGSLVNDGVVLTDSATAIGVTESGTVPGCLLPADDRCCRGLPDPFGERRDGR